MADDKNTAPRHVETIQKPVSVKRLRIGLAVWLASWLPFPVLILAIAHHYGYLQGDSESAQFLAIVYGVQILMGFVGLVVAGKEAAALIKKSGWRAGPKQAWHIIIRGA